jgi:ligand-binding sensor domain-containing protein
LYKHNRINPIAHTLLLALLCLTGLLTRAQQPRFEHFSIPQGLPATETYQLLQDQQGYIWIFTEYGIVKYNGARFIRVCTNLEFPECTIYALHHTTDGRILISNAQSRIYELRNDSAILVKASEKLFDSIPSGIYISKLCALPDHRSFQLTLSNSLSFRLLPDGQLKPVSVAAADSAFTCVEEVVPGQFMITHNANDAKAIRIKRLGRSAVTITAPGLLIKDTQLKLKYINGVLYILTTRELLRINAANQLTVFNTLDKLLQCNARADGHIWLGTVAEGVFELDSNLHILNHYLEELSVSDILPDNQQGIWFSTLERGVFHSKNMQGAYFSHVPELNTSINTIKIMDGTLFASNTKGALWTIRNRQLKRLAATPWPSIPTDFANYPHGYLMATKSGIFLADKTLRSLQPLTVVKDFSPYHSEKFKHRFPASRNPFALSYGLLPLRGDTFLSISAPYCYVWVNRQIIGSILLQYKPRCINRRDTTVFIGSKEGVFTLQPDGLTQPTWLLPLRNKIVNRLVTDSLGNIWVATKGSGLYLIDRYNHISQVPGIPTPFVNDISFYPPNQVLLSTNTGLYVNQLPVQRNRPWQQLFFDEAVQALPFEGQLYIATKDGLVVRDNATPGQAISIPIYLNSVTAHGEKIPVDSLQLSHTQNDLYFNFDFLSYTFPINSFNYQLEGPLTTSGTAEGTQLHLQNLPPGAYTLRISLEPGFATYRSQPLVIGFYIRAAFWQTRLFLVLAVLGAAALILGSVQLYLNRVRKSEQRKAGMMRLLAEYKLTALRAQINPHFISNSLAAIQQLILNDEVDRAGQYIARFNLFIRYVLKYSDQALAPLEDELRIADLNIDLEQLRFSHHFVFEKQVQPGLNLRETRVPPLITQPFIENAIWHGLLPLHNSRQPKLVLRVTQTETELILSIIDNGVGRQSKVAPTTNAMIDESRGTSLIAKRLENLNDIYANTSARIEIHDLTDAQGEACGTHIDIILPSHLPDQPYETLVANHYY